MIFKHKHHFSSFLLLLSVFVIHSLLFIASTSAQSITWQRLYNRYPYNQDDLGYDVCETTDGNFVVVGNTSGFIYAHKINPYGDTLWTLTTISLYAYSVVPSDSGACVLTGIADTNRAFLIKISNNGLVQWNKSYGGINTTLYDVIRTNDGGYFACGVDRTTSYNGLCLKTDRNGNLLWLKTYPVLDLLIMKSAMAMSDGGFVITGISNSYVFEPSKTLIMKLDSTGDTVWKKQIAVFTGNISCQGKTIVSNGFGFLIGGTTGDTITAYSEPFFIRTDSTGKVVYKKVFMSNENAVLLDNILVTQNRFVFSVSRDRGTNTIADIIITDSTGIVIRQKSFNDLGFVVLNSILHVSNGDILFAGSANFNEITRTDICMIRSDSLLNAPPIGIHNISTPILKDFQLFPCYPNPFNPSTKIVYELQTKTLVDIEIFDLLGNSVKKLVHVEQKPGNYEVDWVPAQSAFIYSSGVYFVSMRTSSGIVKTAKIVLLK